MKIKSVVIVSMMCVSSFAHAIRCGNNLIEVGSPVNDVTSFCEISSEYKVNNVTADTVKYYIKESGSLTDEIVVVDGNVTEINTKWR